MWAEDGASSRTRIYQEKLRVEHPPAPGFIRKSLGWSFLWLAWKECFPSSSAGRQKQGRAQFCLDVHPWTWQIPALSLPSVHRASSLAKSSNIIRPNLQLLLWSKERWPWQYWSGYLKFSGSLLLFQQIPRQQDLCELRVVFCQWRIMWCLFTWSGDVGSCTGAGMI